MILRQTMPGTNEEGFVALDVLRQAAGTLGRARFLETYPAPALLVVDVSVAGAAGNADATVQSGPQLARAFAAANSVFRFLDLVAFLVKRPGNPFPNMISVGRAANNDVVLPVETVSKVHGYFTEDEVGWLLTDYRSMNGTQLNGHAIEPAVAVRVSDGAKIRFGEEITVMFLTPQSLYTRAAV